MSRLAARLLLVPVLAIAAAMLVKSASQVGDGFTAGLIAVLAVVIQYLAAGPEATERWLPARRAPLAALLGLALVLAVALQSVLRGQPPLEHLPAPGTEPPELGTLKLTTALGFDAGVFLLVLGAGVATVRDIFLAGADDGEGEVES